MAGPFPERTVLAVSGCTRGLIAHAHTGFVDAALAQADAATLSGLRAVGDRLAISARHHDPRIHLQHRPTESPASDIFEAIERGRLDAIGARWLSGVAKNLLAHPGAENDGVRWLAFEALSGLPAPREKTPLVDAVKAALPKRLLGELVALQERREDHAHVAATAAGWARAAGAVLPNALLAATATAMFPLPTRAVVRQLPRRGDPGATAAPLRDDARDAGQDGDGNASGAATTRGPGAGAYRV